MLRLEGRGGRELTEAEGHLWDPERDTNERVDERDWHPTPDSGWIELDLCHTVAKRRRWWTNLAARRGR